VLKIIVTCLWLTAVTTLAEAQCTAAFLYSGTNDTIAFTNLSQVSNAHYYWNFGDGRTSNEFNPVHRFPASGHYLVSLYALDTLSGCHNVTQTWLEVTRPSSESCIANFSDSLINYMGVDYIDVNNTSVNCNQYGANIDCGPAYNMPPGNSIGIYNWNSALFLGRIQLFTTDTAYGYAIRSEYYRTHPYNYDAATNYDSCSADFEYYISPLTNGAWVTLHAMNPYAQSYHYSLVGMGNPVPLTTRDASFYYPYNNEECTPWMIGLYTTDSSGCNDTLWQQILICNPEYSAPPNCILAAQPLPDQVVVENETVQLVIETDPRTRKQWYMDSGTGLIQLTNAGQFSGVTSDTLTIERVTLSMNNYIFKCEVTSNLSGCSTSSTDASITVVNSDLLLYPNPTEQLVTFVFTSPDTVSTVVIYNAIGEPVLRTSAQAAELTVDLGPLTAGVYIAEVRCREKLYRKRIVKSGDIR
jgi:PKD repeat protein